MKEGKERKRITKEGELMRELCPHARFLYLREIRFINEGGMFQGVSGCGSETTLFEAIFRGVPGDRRGNDDIPPPQAQTSGLGAGLAASLMDVRCPECIQFPAKVLTQILKLGATL